MSGSENGAAEGIEARVGARWWADKIRNGFFPDNGAESDSATKSPMAIGLIAMAQEREMKDVTPEKVDAYEAALACEIQTMLDRGESSYGTALLLGCDYGPGEAHHKALEAAGIRPGMTVLPWKTVMWVQAGSVRVSDGYGAEHVELPLSEPA